MTLFAPGARLPAALDERPRMKWDAFTILEQILILLTIASQIWIAVTVILKSEGAEQYVRIMSFSTGFLAFLITRALGVCMCGGMSPRGSSCGVALYSGSPSAQA